MYIPEYLKEVSPGVWERKEIVKSDSIYITKHYIDDWLAILESDKKHYNNMLPVVEAKMPEIIGKYKKAVCPGGGFPKFETQILKVKNIDVVDFIADIYLKYLNEFRKIYSISEDTVIEYIKTSILEPYEIKGNSDCVCFTHFLEHSESWENVKKWIGLQTKDIVIYGPNIAAAKSINWHHYHNHNIDHNVFFTIEAITEVGKSFGYNVKSLSHSDDLLILFTK